MLKNNLAPILGKKLLKVSKVSKDTGISRTTLTNLYYRRSGSISGDVLCKLCNYLNCTVDELLIIDKPTKEIEDGETNE